MRDYILGLNSLFFSFPWHGSSPGTALRRFALLLVAGFLAFFSRGEAQPVTSVAAANSGIMFIRTDGTLWAMGYNSSGQLGDGTTINRNAPVQVANAVSSVAAGSSDLMFVKADGTLWATSPLFRRPSGDGTGIDYSPVLIASGVVSAAAASSTTMYVKTDGTLWGVGGNSNGQLGDGTTVDRWTAVQITSGVKSVAVGFRHTAFVKIDGTLWTMGSNYIGQLGDGTNQDRSSPFQVASGVAAVAAGSAHTMFVRSDGTLWATGSNTVGQLGDGTNTSRSTPIQVAQAVTSVAAGFGHSLFVTTDGTLWGVGANYAGEMGDSVPSANGDPIDLSTYDRTTTAWRTPLPLARGVSAVATSYGLTAVVKTDGTLWAMGGVRFGEPSYATETPPIPNSLVQIVPVPSLAGFAITSAGGPRVLSEGNNVPSTIAVDPTLTVTSPTATLISAKISITGNFQANEDTLAFNNDGVTMGNIAGFFTPRGVLTLASAGATATLAQWQAALRSITYANASDTPNTAGRTIAFVVNNGTANSLAATRILSVAAVNDAPTDITLSARTVNPAGGVNAVVGTLSSTDRDSASFTYTLVGGSGATDNAAFNLSGSTLRANNSAALPARTYSVRIQTDDGSGGTFARTFTIIVTGVSNRIVASVSAGSILTAFVTTDGTLWETGQSASNTPAPIARGVASVAVGYGSQTMFVKTDGTLWAYGASNFGQGPGGKLMQVATQVASVAVGGIERFFVVGPSAVDARSVGINDPSKVENFRTLFIKLDGTLWGVGGNQLGQLGIGTTTTDEPSPLPIASGVTSVSAGEKHTMFVRSNGTLSGMGDNSSGQLGDGTTTDRHTPVQMADNVASVAAGRAHTVFVKKDGTLWAMGANDGGQLGDGTATNRTTPVQVASGVRSVTAGGDRTLFVKTDGTLWAMGTSPDGALGDGTATQHNTPVQVASGVASVAAGYAHTMFVKTDGTLWGMGANNFGQLGDATRTNRLTPVPVTSSAAIVVQPSSQTATVGQTLSLNVAASGVTPPTDQYAPPIYQWQFNGGAISTSGPLVPDSATIYGSTGSTVMLVNVQPANTGLYSVSVSGGITRSEIAILGLSSSAKVVGAGAEIAHDIFVAANGNTIDQVLLQGRAAAITADYALKQITRMSFIDLSDDIVQVELSGPGTLSLVLDNPSGPAVATNYNQPSVSYMKGHAGIVIAGATEDTNLSVFSVGRITAVSSSLFKTGVTYDGLADLAFIAISSSNGKFGGLRTANASYFATKGLTGVYAPGVAFTGPLLIGNISASDSATPVIVTGSSPDTRITGGDLWQANSQPVQVAGFTQLKFTAGTDSHGNLLPAKINRAILQQDGLDVTAQIATTDTGR